MRQALQRAWLQRGPLACLLWPLSCVYGALVRWHQKRYASGQLPSQSAGVPVLVVGNVVAGGAGKTPVVMALVAHLQAQGWAVGVIARGYGRKDAQCREVHADSVAQDVGDEPLLTVQSFARSGVTLPFFVAPQRIEAARALLARYPNTQVLISDDGLQHHALQRGLEVCVFDDRGLGNGWLLPAGPLREPWPRTYSSAAVPGQATLVLHTGQRPAFAGHRARRSLARHALRGDGTRMELQQLRDHAQPLLALAGIAQPEVFFAMLRDQGLTLARTIAYPDHYNFDSYTGKEYAGYQLICTEKDAVKLWRKAPQALAVPLVLTLDPAFKAELGRWLAQQRPAPPLSSSPS
ncbi:MAG: tetraacyldisaccharide 4'-kinase [Burkholderiaceae bacterium]